MRYMGLYKGYDISDVLTVSFCNGLNDESALCVTQKYGDKTIAEDGVRRTSRYFISPSDRTNDKSSH